MALVAGCLYLNQQASSQSNYTLNQLETALKNDKVVDAKIQPNREVPTGSVTVNVLDEGQKRFYVTDVTEVEKMLR